MSEQRKPNVRTQRRSAVPRLLVSRCSTTSHGAGCGRKDEHGVSRSSGFAKIVRFTSAATPPPTGADGEGGRGE
jgi:hypothetical protein